MLKISTLALVATLGFALPAFATDAATPAKAVKAEKAAPAKAEKAAPAKAAKTAKKSAKKEAAAAEAAVAAEPAYVAPAINGNSK